MNDWKEALCGTGAALSGGAGLLASAVDGGAVVGWVERIGLPTAIILAIGWGLLRFARWVGSRVIEPVVSKHVAFIDTLTATTERQTCAIERIAESEVKSEATSAKTLECVHRIEETAAEDRRTHRLALERITAALEGKADRPPA